MAFRIEEADHEFSDFTEFVCFPKAGRVEDLFGGRHESVRIGERREGCC